MQLFILERRRLIILISYCYLNLNRFSRIFFRVSSYILMPLFLFVILWGFISSCKNIVLFLNHSSTIDIVYVLIRISRLIWESRNWIYSTFAQKKISSWSQRSEHRLTIAICCWMTKIQNPRHNMKWFKPSILCAQSLKSEVI